MSNLNRIYTRTLHKHFGNLYANWLPNDPISLGDFGEFEDGIFVGRGNIVDKFHIPISVRAGTGGAANYAYTSGRGIEVTSHAKADVSPVGVELAKAQMQISFTHGDSVFFNSAACIVESIADQVELGRRILQLFESAHWKYHWVVVTSIVKAGPTTIVVSGTGDASITLEAEGDVPHIDLSKADVGVKAGSKKNIGFELVTKGNISPLFAASRVHRRPWSGPGFEFDEPDNPMPPEDLRDAILQKGQLCANYFEFAVTEEEI